MAFSGYSYLNTLPQSEAQQLYRNGASLLLFELPQGSVFGVDKNSWIVGDKFLGLKMIPPGLHFIFCQATNKSGGAGPIVGLFHHFQKEEVFVKVWSRRLETFEDKQFTDQETETFKLAIKDYEPSLAPYPYDKLKLWVSLSNHITENTLDRIEINAKILSHVLITDSNDKCPQSSGGECYNISFTQILKPKLLSSATPAEISQAYMDKSDILKSMLNERYNCEFPHLLGELQISYLLFTCTHIYRGFEQWRNLIELLCGCNNAIVTETELYSRLISVLYFQLSSIPDDFFVWSDDKDVTGKQLGGSQNILVSLLANFFRNVSDSKAHISLKKKTENFKAMLIYKFKWQLEESDEDLPVILPN